MSETNKESIMPEEKQTPKELEQERKSSEIINQNLDKALSLTDIEPLLNEIDHACSLPENADVNPVLTLLFEINHELIVRGTNIYTPNIPDEILFAATRVATKSIRNSLIHAQPPKRNAVQQTLKRKRRPLGGSKRGSDDAPEPAPPKQKEKDAQPDEQPQPIAAAAEIKAQALKASNILVPFDPLSRKLLSEKPKPKLEPQRWSVETFKGEPATKRHPEIQPGIVSLTLSLDADGLQRGFPNQPPPVHILGEFGYFDMRFTLAFQALWEKAEELGIPVKDRYFSIAEICKHMSASAARPASSQMQRARDTAEKLMFLRMQIDTQGEAHLRNHSKSRVSAFLPAELLFGKMNSNETVLLHPYTETPLFAFAKERGQFTTVPISVFNKSPLSLTEDNMSIEYYLLSRVSKMNYSHEWEPVIKIDTFLNECGINPPAEGNAADAARYRQRKKRAIANAEKWLEHLQKHGVIKEYSKERDRFLITPKDGKNKQISGKSKK